MTNEEASILINTAKAIVVRNTDCCEKVLEALDMAILSLKGYAGMTNGEVMQAVYADSEISFDETWKTVTVYLGADEDYCEDEVRFDLDWWNAPYKKGGE